MSKHTPGPWTLDHMKNLVGSNGERVICSSNGLSFGSAAQYKDAKANARLIAAAPELLDALEALLDKVTDIRGIDMDVYAHYQLEQARAAIAKATGDA